ncbi:MAG: hydrolase family protein [Bacteroidetes bacterium]|nr:hydrolase family protein [Bacteroidota bacterium]
MNIHKYRFLALGDSYTIGESVNPEEGWPSQLATSLRKERVDLDDPLIIAKTGWTTDELEEAIDQWKPEGSFDLVTLLIGVNNQYRGRSEKEYRTQFVRLLQRAVEYARDDASRVIVLSIPDWGVTPFAKDRDTKKIAAEIDRFNSINLEEAKAAGAWYVDVTPVSRKATQDASLIAGDGLHPSGTMYAEWARLTLPTALKILKTK